MREMGRPSGTRSGFSSGDPALKRWDKLFRLSAAGSFSIHTNHSLRCGLHSFGAARLACCQIATGSAGVLGFSVLPRRDRASGRLRKTTLTPSRQCSSIPTNSQSISGEMYRSSTSV
jgi:hypothetical protein